MSDHDDHLKELFDSFGFDNELLINEEEETSISDQVFHDSKEEHSQEDEWFDSLNSEDYDAVVDYGTTPPRTIRNRKQKERNAFCFTAAEAAKTFHSKLKHKSASRCASLPAGPQNINSNNGHSNHSIRRRKRSHDLQRSKDRQCKLQIEEIQPDMEPEQGDAAAIGGSRSESLPPICLAVKVIQRARYLSLSSKRVGSGKNFCRRMSMADIPPDRVSFHSLITGLLSNASQDQNIQSVLRSEEDVLYQQELNEMLWLELQAWHAGHDTVDYDNLLLENRQKVKEVYDEVISFNFNVMYYAKEDKKISFFQSGITNEFRPYSSFDTSDSQFAGSCTTCLGCLSIWCELCREKESVALDHVWHLLERVDEARALFPSFRKLIHFFPAWSEKDFTSRYKALCLWYNTTNQLRFITDLLGRRLGHLSNDSIPWPNFPNTKSIAKSPALSTNSRDSGNISTDEPIEFTNRALNPTTTKGHTPIVRFEFDDLDEGLSASDPGQSYESDITSASSGSITLVSKDSQAGLDHLCPPTVVGGLRRSSSDIFLQANPYRNYVEHLLRNKGMRKTLDKVEEVIGDVMSKTICIVEESQRQSSDKILTMDPSYDNGKLVMHPLKALQEELHEMGGWTETFNSLGLPRFHTLFLFLASIPMYMMRECLKLRLEQMPVKPSQLSIKQLMYEYKEGIRLAVGVRQKYVKWCFLIQKDLPSSLSAKHEDRQSQATAELDCNVKRMLEVYLDWLEQFMLMLHRQPNQSGLQRTFLQEEWHFVQSTCPYVSSVESLAASRFCNIACHLLCSVGKFLDAGLEDIASGNEEINEKNEEIDIEVTEESDGEEEGDEQDVKRKKFVQLCRRIQLLLSESRERGLRAIALAKMLKKDLEVAIKGTVASMDKLLPLLQHMGHILIKGYNEGLYIFVPGHMKEKQVAILPLLQMQFEVLCDSPPYDYVILLFSREDLETAWQGPSADYGPTMMCAITLCKMQASDMVVIAHNTCSLTHIKSNLMEGFEEVVTFSSEAMSPDEAVNQALLDMKNESLHMCKALEGSITNAQRLVSTELPTTGEEENRQLSHILRDTVHQGYLFGFEYHKEVMRLLNCRQKETLAPILAKFARSWVMFVRVHYSSGRGSKPRWALPGLEFLLFVCDPHITSLLTNADFKKLCLDVENGREYIIGSADNNSGSTPSTPGGLGSRPFRSYLRHSQRSIDRSHDEESPIERVRLAVKDLESSIEEQRMREKLIGKVSEYHRDTIEIKPHSVSFSWQRGFKIGSGRFAKVYTAVNNSSGELLAMKVLPLQPNDHRTIKKVTSELRIFESIGHPHLVKYYGVEIHKDEMRIFMEYCDEGTLEALASSTEGLPEEIVRKYTLQLLSAVLKLHENSIVHRDIKGANIFLAKENNILKLGDFGCAVRLRSHQTEVGELSGIVGTHAFMAPEIFGSNEGHGRAADIWSTGCVVIEMVTGKRPWPQYDHSVQIMFRVGSGKSPAAPDSLSEEGKDFLELCFIHDPKERATAARLLDHTFVKVEDEETSLPLLSGLSAPSKGFSSKGFR